MSGNRAADAEDAAPRRPRWKRAAIVVTGLCAGLGLAEIGLRVAGFEYRLAPEVIDFGAPSRHEIETYFAADEDLIWVPRDYAEKLAEYRQSRPALVFMGDSCTHLGTYPQRVAERVLRAAGKSSLTFANLGVVGWSTYQGRRQLERDVVPLRPRVVTLYYGWNDHWVGFGIEDAQVGRIASLARYGLSGSRLTQAAAKVWVAADPQAGTRPNRVSPDDFRANLTSMVRIAREHGIEPVLVTAPSYHVPGEAPPHLLERFLRSADELVPMHERYVQIVRDVAAAERAPLCDLAAHFAQRGDRARLFDADGIHPNPAGDDVVAEQLLATFREHGLVARLFE